ncbi:hypothetical protein [Pseudomonas sp.]|uniref:hypothetical protein n=1 Tax=Pseudomonas sp. TaxID=306 RepID=UPI003C66C5A8
MHQPDESSANSLRYFAGAVLCVAVLLGVYFMQLNAKTDRQRQEAAERLALCRQVERVASAASVGGVELSEACKKLINQSTGNGTSK